MFLNMNKLFSFASLQKEFQTLFKSYVNFIKFMLIDVESESPSSLETILFL